MDPPSTHIGLCTKGASKKLAENNRRISATLKAIGSEVVVYPASVDPRTKTSQLFEQDKQLSFIQLNQIPSSRLSFLQSALDVFVRLHSSTETETVMNRVRDSSFQLQQIIYDYAQSAHAMASEGTEIQVEASLFAAIHSVWQLARVVWFSSESEPLRSRLTEWLTINHEDGLAQEYERIVGLISPREYNEFWPFVYRCILRGHFQVVQFVLETLPTYKYTSLETASNTNPVATLIRLLTAMPVGLSSLSSRSQNEMMRWRDEVSFIFENGSLSSLQVDPQDMANFSTIFSILLGDEKTILNVSKSWQEALVGLSLFVHSSMNESKFPTLVDSLRSIYSPESLLDKILWSIVETDIASLIRHCAELDWWLATHLIDLLDMAGFLDDKSLLAELYKDSEPSLIPLSEWYRMAFADYLLSSPDLWRVALEYFAHCPTVGKSMLELVIPQIPLDSTRKIQKVLSFCQSQELWSTRLSICKILGKQALLENRHVEAISWFVEAKDLQQVEFIADSLLDTVLKPGHAQLGLDIAKSLNPKLLESSARLRFLYEYYKYREFYDKKDFKAAGKRLVLLLTSGSTPSSFYPLLIVDAIPLLEGHIQVFGQQDTFELMRCVEQYATRSETAKWKPGLTPSHSINVTTPDDVHSIDIAKLALARNLSRAIVSNKA